MQVQRAQHRDKILKQQAEHVRARSRYFERRLADSEERAKEYTQAHDLMLHDKRRVSEIMEADRRSHTELNDKIKQLGVAIGIFLFHLLCCTSALAHSPARLC